MSQTPVQTAVLTLDSLLMRTGPLAGLLPDVGRWTTIAGRLRESYPADEWKGSVAELCTVYYRHGAVKPFVHTKPYGEQTDQITALVGFLEHFMGQNGQWPYLERQPWYRRGEYVVAVDINYYADRSGYKVAPAFHKDTGGNNIFVNLIFDNTATIEATEWFADLTQPSTQRAQWQAKLLPAEHLAELAAARKSLAPAHEGKEVSGGVTEGRYVFVSWVDDLVWHATPSVTKRLELDAASAIDMYAQLGERVLKPVVEPGDNEYQFYHAELATWISALSVVGSIAECPTTALHRWLADKGHGPQDLTNRTAPQAWRELYTGDRGRIAYEKDVRERAGTPWRVTATANEANAVAAHLPGSEVIKETPVGLSTRRRVNSTAPEAVEKVGKLNENTPRTFIRTWVRILPATGSPELVTNEVVF
jgi:hypothetical protein